MVPVVPANTGVITALARAAVIAAAESVRQQLIITPEISSLLRLKHSDLESCVAVGLSFVGLRNV